MSAAPPDRGAAEQPLRFKRRECHCRAGAEIETEEFRFETRHRLAGASLDSENRRDRREAAAAIGDIDTDGDAGDTERQFDAAGVQHSAVLQQVAQLA